VAVGGVTTLAMRDTQVAEANEEIIRGRTESLGRRDG
jgi:hypothetical protein